VPHWTKTREGKEILQTRKMARAALEFDDFQQELRKKHKLTLREMYDLVQGSASIYIMELLKGKK
jgi:hypothetical protein